MRIHMFLLDKSLRRWRWAALIAIVITLTSAAIVRGASARLTIVVPGGGEGGWGRTAQMMKRVLQEAGLVRDVELVYYPGGGGTVGLAQFLHGYRGNPNAILIGGSALIGSAQASGATVSLLQTTPIARLTGETLVVVVPAGSPFTTFRALREAFRENPTAISWAAGHHGGAEQQLLARIAGAEGIPPNAVRYVPSPGGGDSLRTLLDARASAGIAGYDQVIRNAGSHRLQALAIASATRLPGSDLPTMKEQGMDLHASKWRAVFAAPGIDSEARAHLRTLIQAMVGHISWRSGLAQHRWTDLHLDGDAFARFLEAEHAPRSADRDRASVTTPVNRSRRAGPLLAALALGGAALTVGLVTRRRRKLRPVDLPDQRLGVGEGRVADPGSSFPLETLKEDIERQFERWDLTAAEREIAWLMLNGFRHKKIAELRRTSERTVRHQALGIYRKTGLDGRMNLSAHFLLHARAPRR